MESKEEFEKYDRAIRRYIAAHYPIFVGKSVTVLDIGEETVRFGVSIPFGSFTISKSILNNYI